MNTKAFTFTVSQILEIAERLEHNGSQFYKRMAKLYIPDSQRWNLCQDLADWREGRELALAHQRQQFYEKETKIEPIDPDDYLQIHPDAMADLAVFTDKLYPCHLLTGHESQYEIIKDAVAKTRDAITFYRGLKDFARNQETQIVINQIIEEEKRYIGELLILLNEEIADEHLSGGKHFNVENEKQDLKKPPLSAGRITSEILAGIGVSLAIIMMVGWVMRILHFYLPFMPVFLLIVIAVSVIIAVSVYCVGSRGNQTGSFRATLRGSLLGLFVSVFVMFVVFFLLPGVSTVSLFTLEFLLLTPLIFATISFNRSRRYKQLRLS